MNKIRYLFFDCMETLVDLWELPSSSDYGRWAFEGSDVECLWRDFDEFYHCYEQAIIKIKNELPQYKEYDMYTRLFEAVRIKFFEKSSVAMHWIAEGLYRRYWDTYRGKCYVREEVRTALMGLHKQYRMGVVSNFMVRNGIQDLLQENGIFSYFEFVVTSIEEGWRKPHTHLYQVALQKAQVSVDNSVFIGDDLENDYNKPKELGFSVIFLDRKARYPELKEGIEGFEEIEGLLSRMEKDLHMGQT